MGGRIGIGLLWAGVVLGAPAVGRALEQPEALGLAGPSVGSPSASATLVTRGFDGRIRVLEVSPEEAALALLSLRDEERAGAERVLNERATILDRIVFENVRMLLDVQAAQATGDARALGSLLVEFQRRLLPLRERGSLRDELAGVLASENLARLDAMVAEYERAIEDEARERAASAGERFRRFEFLARTRLERLGLDVKRSYERGVASRIDDLEGAIASIGLSAESEATVRRLALEFAQKTMLKASEVERSAFARDVYRALKPDERRRLLEHARKE